MKSKNKDPLLRKYNLKLGKYYFYKHYFIAEVNEGVTITIDQLDELLPLIIKHYGDSIPFTYISDRINSYSITPIDYKTCPLNTMKNFKAYAVVTYNTSAEMTSEIEKHFAQRPFYRFQSVSDAISWSKRSFVHTN